MIILSGTRGCPFNNAKKQPSNSNLNRPFVIPFKQNKNSYEKRQLLASSNIPKNGQQRVAYTPRHVDSADKMAVQREQTGVKTQNC
ncbi:unnamed protein product [Ceratitis capitata]|uniref:(Mediterranean fruit fly) hypothetical protein n=1 Tax=Ceratitis capitata TaxID=7213 RepID=A0A811U0T4_CERCA|nr:unnamed protein product [Ceratitis capitata]